MSRESSRVLVTGCAGFIGSQIVERLIEMGMEVVGMDAIRDAYDISLKRKNLQDISHLKGFQFHEVEIENADLETLMKDVRAVFHTAGQAGVRTSWGKRFDVYLRDNIQATQRLLEASVNHPTLERFIYSSSSSIYGNADVLPVTEETLPKPVSPYGVTKLSAEHLCSLYATTSGVPVVSLRYFTVYGPRQRPDMAFHILCKSIITNSPFTMLGDGEQTRDFTYISDIVDANISAMTSPMAQGVYNIAGGSRASLMEAIHIIENITGKSAKLEIRESAKGDAKHTWADTSRAQHDLNFNPKIKLPEGLRAEYEWAASIYGNGKEDKR